MQSHHDVTNTVDLTDATEVCGAVCDILNRRFADAPLDVVRNAFDTFARLYGGTLPGYVGCDTWYHDAQHSLDATLAYTRLIDGCEISEPQASLGAERAAVGVLIALFHDAGYIRRQDDTIHRNGAEFTLNHVRRSGEFLADYLPTVGLGHWADRARQIVHFTGYEVALDQIKVDDPLDERLGHFLGTVDLLAQMADTEYLEKCWHHLYHEFEICGLAGDAQPGRPAPAYSSPNDLMRKTPAFNQSIWDERLNGHFGRCYRYFDAHFGGSNQYVEAVEQNIQRLQGLLDDDKIGSLQAHRPEVIAAPALQSAA
ncbi:hypothetical protein GYB61_00400 [bacterium]|nr:hypothetical protein [bacterium]